MNKREFAKLIGKIEDEIRGASGLSMLEPRGARKSALEWLNRKAERKDWYGRWNGNLEMQ